MKYPTIALRFSDILNLRGLKARELAEKAEMTEGAISHYVNGNRVPGNKTATKLGKILDVNPLWLMDLSADMETEENKDQAKRIADELVKLLDADDIKTIMEIKKTDDEKAKLKLYMKLIEKASKL